MVRKKEKLSLLSSFILIYLLIVGVLSGVITFGFHHYRSQMIRGELGLQAGIMTAEIAPLIDKALKQNDLSAAYRLLRSFSAFPPVLCAGLLDTDTTLISWPKIECSSIASDQVDYVYLPFGDQGLRMQLAIDSAYQRHQSWQVTKTFSVLVFAVMAIIALVVTFMISRIILRPLMRLQRAMTASTPDNLMPAMNLNDEALEGTGQAYNQLAQSAQTYFQQMQQTQIQLHESQERFRDMAEISTDWFYEMDADFRLLYLSEQFYKITGLSPKDVEGNFISDLAATKAEGKSWLGLKSDMQNQSEFRQHVIRVKTDNGRDCVVALSGKPVFDKNHKFTGYRGTGRDITQFQLNQEKLSEANQNFGDSLAYASHFQHNLLADEASLRADFGEVRFIWQPRDLVGGDFLTQFTIEDVPYIAFYDCTGHGVPGGFMVMLVTAALDRIKMQADAPLSCADILQKLHNEISVALGITARKSASDGLDCAIICKPAHQNHIEFSGANIDLFTVYETGQIKRHQSLRQSLGYRYSNKGFPFRSHWLECDGACFVLFSDGITTQMGGSQPLRMMGTEQVISVLGQAKTTNPRKLANKMMQGLRSWQGNQRRRDDLMILAFRPD